MASPLKRSKFQDLNKFNTVLEPNKVCSKDNELNENVNLFFSVCLGNDEWKEEEQPFIPLHKIYPCAKPKARHVVYLDEDF